MTRVDPILVAALSDLARGLRALEIDFCIIGALVPEFLLGVPPRFLTNDADATVVLDSLADFERLKERLAEFGFVPAGLPYRLTHRDGGRVDLLPYSKILVPTGHLDLARDLSFNMAGFDQVVPNAVHVSVTPDLTVPMVPIPLYVLLKLVAYGDRREPKDLASVLHCLRHYAEDDDRRYGLDHNGEAVPFEHTCAYLLGHDGRRFCDRPVAGSVGMVLDRFDSPDAAVVGIVAREDGRVLADDEDRAEIFELFRWFRLGAGV
jgi:predicted nucleotidyltransferase